MLKLQIADIKLSMCIQDFERELKDFADNYSESMNYMVKPMSTKRGKNMYKVVIDNYSHDVFEIIGERDDVTGDIHFHPLKLQNMNESFYNCTYSDPSIIGQDNDPAVFVTSFLKLMCTNTNKGSFAYIESNGNPVIIKDGSHKRTASIALVDGDGNIYSCSGAKSIKGATDDVGFSVNKPIGEWVSENPDVQREIAKLPSMDAKMNYIGKYLITAKVNEEIDSDEFMDIFCQAGIIGFSEPSVINIYKLIM